MATTDSQPHLADPDDLAALPAIGERFAVPIPGVTARIERGASLTDPEAARVIEFLRLAFNGGPNWFAYGDPLGHLIWKVRDCPVPTYVTLQERDGGELVKYAWGIDRRFLLAGVERAVGDGGESATHPDLQGQGLYSRMRRLGLLLETREGLDMALSVSTHPAILRYERSDPQRPPLGNNVLTLARPLGLGRLDLLDAGAGAGGRSNTSLAIAASRRRLPRPRWARRLAWTGRMLGHRLRHRPYLRAQRTDWTIRTVERFDGRIDAFFEQAAQQFDLIQVRDAAYLNWRLCDPRGGPFLVRIAERDGEILGYCAMLASESRPAIVDLLALPGRLDVVRSLVEDAVAEFRRRGAPAVSLRTVRRHPHNDVLRRLGFLDRNAVAVASFRAITVDGAASTLLRDPACRVHLTYADSDNV
jgi:hypothetical protein